MSLSPEIAIALAVSAGTTITAFGTLVATEFRTRATLRKAKADQEIKLEQARADAQAAVERARSDAEAAVEKARSDSAAAEEKRKQDIDNYFFQQTKLVDEIRSRLIDATEKAATLQGTVNAMMAEKETDKLARAERDRIIGEQVGQIKDLIKSRDQDQVALHQLREDLKVKSETQADVQKRFDQTVIERDNALAKIGDLERRVTELEQSNRDLRSQIDRWQSDEMQRQAELVLARRTASVYRAALEKANKHLQEFGLEAIDVFIESAVTPEQIAKARHRQNTEDRLDLARLIERANAGEQAIYEAGLATPPPGNDESAGIVREVMQANKVDPKIEAWRAEFNTPPDQLDNEAGQS